MVVVYVEVKTRYCAVEHIRHKHLGPGASVENGQVPWAVKQDGVADGSYLLTVTVDDQKGNELRPNTRRRLRHRQQRDRRSQETVTRQMSEWFISAPGPRAGPEFVSGHRSAYIQNFRHLHG